MSLTHASYLYKNNLIVWLCLSKEICNKIRYTKEMTTLEYIPTHESQRERRLSLEHELHRAESISIEEALPEGFNIDENDYLGQNQMDNHRMNLKSIFSMIFCCHL